jgi:hypothetical protein
MSDEPRLRMMVPRNPEPVKWKVNQKREQSPKVKITSGMLLEKYAQQQRVSVCWKLSGVKRQRSPHTRLQRVGTEEIGMTQKAGAHRSQHTRHRKSAAKRGQGTTGMIVHCNRFVPEGQGGQYRH